MQVHTSLNSRQGTEQKLSELYLVVVLKVKGSESLKIIRSLKEIFEEYIAFYCKEYYSLRKEYIDCNNFTEITYEKVSTAGQLEKEDEHRYILRIKIAEPELGEIARRNILERKIHNFGKNIIIENWYFNPPGP